MYSMQPFILAKEASESTKSVVYGYLRRIYPLFSDLVFYICLMYYYESEYFDKCGEGHIISDDKRTVTRSVFGVWNSTVYCHKWINSNTNNIITWTFKIAKNEDRGIAVGICSSDDCLNGDFQAGTVPSYSICTNGYMFIGGLYTPAHQYEKLFEQSNIISIILDLKQAKLCYKLNDKLKDLITGITKRDDVRYKFAIAMTNEGDCIELMDHFVQ